MGGGRATFYRWKKKVLGIGVAEVRRLEVLGKKHQPQIGFEPPADLTSAKPFALSG